MSEQSYLSSIDEIIEDARNGKMFILVDDEDRENEGDLVIPAQMADAEAVNFMAKYGRGLICLSMTHDRIEHLGLDLMSKRNKSRHDTAFTVSIEAREGVTTGISAADRARTIEVAIADDAGPSDIVTPGHVFPLLARDGGVLVRAGHTEAAVDIARLAGLQPSGVICEIMNDDGTMARMNDLVQFAQFHGLKIGTIADLIKYRREREHLVQRAAEAEIESIHGGAFHVVVYATKINKQEHIALIRGDLHAPGPVPVRMHALDIFDDILGDAAGKPNVLQRAMSMLGREERGVVVLLWRDPEVLSLADRVRHRAGETVGKQVRLRDYGIGAQILSDLGLKEIELITNSTYSVVGLEGYGIEVVDSRPLEGE